MYSEAEAAESAESCCLHNGPTAQSSHSLNLKVGFSRSFSRLWLNSVICHSQNLVNQLACSSWFHEVSIQYKSEEQSYSKMNPF
jgi:hypothetical protein